MQRLDDGAHDVEALGDLLGGDDERRREADDVVVRGLGEEAGAHAVRGGVLEAHAQVPRAQVPAGGVGGIGAHQDGVQQALAARAL